MTEKDGVYQQLRGHLAALKLTAVAEALATAPEQAEQTKPGYTRFLADLLAIEVHAAEQRALQSRLRLAGFPQTKTLEEFDFDAQPTLDRRLIEELATLRFVEEKANVLFIGPPGVGKTTLAIALALKAVQAGYRVYYTTAADLVARTAKAAVEGRRRGRAPIARHHRLGLRADSRRAYPARDAWALSTVPALGRAAVDRGPGGAGVTPTLIRPSDLARDLCVSRAWVYDAALRAHPLDPDRWVGRALAICCRGRRTVVG